MNCIILDDEPQAVDVLARYVEQTPSLTLMGTFRNPLKALEFLRKENIQLIFLDINMPNLSGIQFLKSLRNQPLVIFTTAYSSYAVESYEWDAVDYLVKPIIFERFLKAANKAIDQLKSRGASTGTKVEFAERQDEVILLKSGALTHRVHVSDILFVAKGGNYLEVNTLEKKIVMRANMGDLFSWLPAELFCRIHKSFVVSLKHVDTIEAHQIRIGKIILPIGASYRDEFLKRIMSII
jgi:two-component system, LytTR family, response regulator